MNNVLSRVQMLETSEDCKKFSKSVSYETLVAGTATIGRGRKQTRRLSKGSAVKPLSAVGTLTSLLCNSAKVMEKLLRHVITRRTSVRRGYLPEQGIHANEESLFASVTCFMRLPRRIQRMLLVMTIPTLALIFTLATTSESSAETWDCGEIANTVSCSLDENGVFTISGTGKMKDYPMTYNNGWHNNCPWGSISNIQTVVVGKGVTSIGDSAFAYATGLKSITIPDSVTSIEGGVFYGATGLTSITIPDSVTSIGAWAFYNTKSLTSITIPDSVKSIEGGAFANASSLTSITIPDSVTSIGDFAFQYASSLESIIIPDNINTANWPGSVFGYLPEKTDIVCLGDEEKCKQKLAKYIPKDKGGTCTNFCINNEIQPALFDSCKSTNYFWDGSTCIREPDVTKRKCCTSCKDMGGWCNRIRYTPAEAAKVLKDENNEIVITFRK